YQTMRSVIASASTSAAATHASVGRRRAFSGGESSVEDDEGSEGGRDMRAFVSAQGYERTLPPVPEPGMGHKLRLVSKLIMLNKPFGVLCQFTDREGRPTLADLVPVPNVYPAGRLDADSEGLLALTDDGRLQHRITDPRHRLAKTYWVQVEGVPTREAI